MALQHLKTDLRINDADAFYAELIAATSDLTDDQASLMQAKLVLLLANHIGDRQVLSEALVAAREDLA